MLNVVSHKVNWADTIPATLWVRSITFIAIYFIDWMHHSLFIHSVTEKILIASKF